MNLNSSERGGSRTRTDESGTSKRSMVTSERTDERPDFAYASVISKCSGIMMAAWSSASWGKSSLFKTPLQCIHLLPMCLHRRIYSSKQMGQKNTWHKSRPCCIKPECSWLQGTSKCREPLRNLGYIWNDIDKYLTRCHTRYTLV